MHLNNCTSFEQAYVERAKVCKHWEATLVIATGGIRFSKAKNSFLGPNTGSLDILAARAAECLEAQSK